MEYFHSVEPGAGTALFPAAAMFVSHGAPTVALEEDGYHRSLREFAKKTGIPRAVVVLSSHWLTDGAFEVTAVPVNPTIHDFSGFPKELYDIEYAAPGDQALAREIGDLLAAKKRKVLLNHARGLDHGAWVPLMIMYPDHRVPVVQISLPLPATPELLFAAGEALKPLRARGVLMLGSGSMTHNLALLSWRRKEGPPFPEAAAFDRWVAEKVKNRDAAELFEFHSLAPNASHMHPTDEHFLPLFFTLGCAGDEDRLETLYDGFHYGGLAMRSFAFVQGA